MSEEIKQDESKLEQVTDKVVHNVEDGVDAVKETGQEIIDVAKSIMKDGELPEAKKSLVLGLVALLCSGFFIGAPFGIVFGIKGMKNSKLAMSKINENPSLYKKEKVKAIIGKFTGLGGLILGIIYSIAIIVMIIGSIADA